MSDTRRALKSRNKWWGILVFKGPSPRVFGLPPGADFPKVLYQGLEDRLATAAPHDWAAVEIYVNTRRMQRRLIDLFNAGPARLMPRIRLITDIASVYGVAGAGETVSPLRRRLELAQVVSRLLDSAPDLAPRSAIFDLADSLAELMDEMQGEGVSPDAIRDLDVSHLSAHWDRTRRFIDLIAPYFTETLLNAEGQRRLAAERLTALWAETPPTHPIIVAGSTGSRGATSLFMQAVAKLPQGAVILPGFDFDQPAAVWDALDDALTAEDHPQYRFHKFHQALDITAADVHPWADVKLGSVSPRNALVSLALRPAPVTDQWLESGPDLTDLDRATEGLTLIEAQSPRHEALAIALRLRQAVERGETAALISPDRMLTRQVTAALDRWGIEPDDSAGIPLQLTAPGRFLRHVGALMGTQLTAEALLILLKHPLTHSSDQRNQHLLWTRELELHIRRKGIAFPDPTALMAWAAAKDDARATWAEWIYAAFLGHEDVQIAHLSDHLNRHIATAEEIARGAFGADSGELWLKKAGEKARTTVDNLTAEAEFGGDLHIRDYLDLFGAVLSTAEVTDPVRPHPQVMIWGTLEARVQGADVVILGGLNEGSWPEAPSPDPWLNREMRAKSGLLLPERRIGLAAHDFQQAIGAPTVILSRAIRDAEAQTVPSRWINRLVNLMSGLTTNGGPDSLAAMRARGQALLDMVDLFDAPIAQPTPAPRPEPAPPVAYRPDRLSVTRVQTLIRDPYAIYASYVLSLRRLNPLRPKPDAALRGTVLHKVLEEFVRDADPNDAGARADLMAKTDTILADMAPWPADRRAWRAAMERAADWFVEGEVERRKTAVPERLEVRAQTVMENGFTLTAEADRIDRNTDGTVTIYDYKTGRVPTKAEMDAFDKQLYLEAILAERGAFQDMNPTVVHSVAHIGMGSDRKVSGHMMNDTILADTWSGLAELVDRYRDPTLGYKARRALTKTSDRSDYDHLSRFGEWNESTPPTLIKVGRHDPE